MRKEIDPKIQLLIPTKDKPGNVDRLLDSLKSYGYLERSNFQAVVVDSSSNTDTQQVSNSYPVEYLDAPGMGKSSAMNFAIGKLSSEYVAFLDDDIVIINSNWLDYLMSNFTKESAAYVSGKVVAFQPHTEAQQGWEEKGALNKGGRRIEVGPEFFQKIRFRGVPLELVTMGANHVVRRAALEEIGNHDERFGPGQPIPGAGADLDLTYKVLKRGYKIIYDPRAIVAHEHPKTTGELRSKLFGYGVSDTAIHTKFALEFGDIRSIFQLVYRPAQNFTRLARSLVGKYPLPPSVLLSGIAGNLIGPLYYFKYRDFLQEKAKDVKISQ